MIELTTQVIHHQYHFRIPFYYSEIYPVFTTIVAELRTFLVISGSQDTVGHIADFLSTSLDQIDFNTYMTID